MYIRLVQKTSKFYDQYKRFCLLPPCKASLPKTILPAFIDIMLLDDFSAICFLVGRFLLDRFLGDRFSGDRFSGNRFSESDFRGQIFRGRSSDRFLTYISKLFLL